MKRIIVSLIIVMVLAFLPITAFAAAPAETEASPIAITVVVPPQEQNKNASPQSGIPQLYPAGVFENRVNGRREIIRVYELSPSEDPAYIPREPFERDGFRFELAEITRQEMPQYSTFEHTETVAVNTQTNDLATVIRLLSPTLEFISEDGYFGILSLDVTSIQTESDGTKTTSQTVTKTREYPHLSNPDTSLVPRTITENGATYSLANVDWNSQNTVGVDYTPLAESYTALASYTRTASKTSITGYTTTAEYKGTLSKITAGKTQYAATYIGIPIVTPNITMVTEKKTGESPTIPAEPEVAVIEKTEPETAVIDTAETETIVIESNEPDIPEQKTMPEAGLEMDIEAEKELDNTMDIKNDEEPLSDIDIDIDLESGDNGKAKNVPTALSIIGFTTLFVLCVILAYFFGKKGKAMFNIGKRFSALALCFGVIFGSFRNTYAASSLPDYGFGKQGIENTVYFSSGTTSEDTVYPGKESSNENLIYFDTGILNGMSRDSPSDSAEVYNDGDFIGVLKVERFNKSINVYSGATLEAMAKGGGHFSFTGINKGNTAIIGHNRGRLGFFNFVKELTEGDVITLEAGGVIKSYAVSMLYHVDDTDFTPFSQYGDNRLTLVTCVENQGSRRRIAVALEIE